MNQIRFAFAGKHVTSEPLDIRLSACPLAIKPFLDRLGGQVIRTAPIPTPLTAPQTAPKEEQTHERPLAYSP